MPHILLILLQTPKQTLIPPYSISIISCSAYVISDVFTTQPVLDYKRRFNRIMMHMPGTDNPADILSKHWAYQAVYQILKLILFFLGNTADLIQEG
jgi:hypothetical protein